MDTDWDDLFLSVQSNTTAASPPDPMKFISVYPPETGLMVGAEMPVKGVIPPAFPSFTLAQLQQGTESRDGHVLLCNMCTTFFFFFVS